MSYSKKNTYAALTLLFSSYHWVMGLEIEYLTIKVLTVCKKEFGDILRWHGFLFVFLLRIFLFFFFLANKGLPK